MTDRHEPRHQVPFHKSSLPLRPEEAIFNLVEPDPGHPQVIVNGVAHPISEKDARKLRDAFVKRYGAEG